MSLNTKHEKISWLGRGAKTYQNLRHLHLCLASLKKGGYMISKEVKEIIQKEMDYIEEEVQENGDYQTAYCKLVDIIENILDDRK
jgi:hypothetical protein